MALGGFAGRRVHAECPRCGALERHRVQFLAIARVLGRWDPGGKSMLHVAPEPFLRTLLAPRFARYETADIEMRGVDHRADLRRLPFGNASYDLVFASHVLEHIVEDEAAIAEIRRVLKPAGIAVLPVPVVCQRTIEYPAPNPREAGHVRAPGPDYFEKYRRFFTRVEVFDSSSFSEVHQPYIYEDRTGWPTAEMPLRPPMAGVRHHDFVPVCYV
ncbi:MAG: class I SAM-dependent methyltransferase [Stellaceae bacterium]